MGNGFGLDNKEVEKEYQEFIDEYVEISPLMGHERFRGRLVRIEKGHAVLNPHYSQEYNNEGAKYSLKDKNQKVNLMVPFAIRPVTREDLEALCVLATEDARNDVKKMREGKKD